MRRPVVIAGSLVCFLLAAGLLLFAVDVKSWRDAMPRDDVGYRVAADAGGLWRPQELVPFALARRTLGLDDDLAFRRAVRALRLGRLEDQTISDPRLVLRRDEAQARLEAIAAGSGDPTRRSQAFNLIGVLALVRLASETQDRTLLLKSAVSSLQRAIALDPKNDDAKFNLELALQRGRGIQLTEGAGGPNPTPGGKGAKGAGAGEPGTGY